MAPLVLVIIWLTKTNNSVISLSNYFIGYVNEYDANVLHACSNGGYLNGVHSVHNNKKEDRRYKFRCCTPRSGDYLSILSKNEIWEVQNGSIFSFLIHWYYILSRVWKLICVYFKDITTKTVNGPAGSIIGMKPSVILLPLITSSEVWVAFTTTRRSKYSERKHKLWNLKLIQSEGM